MPAAMEAPELLWFHKASRLQLPSMASGIQEWQHEIRIKCEDHLSDGSIACLSGMLSGRFHGIRCNVVDSANQHLADITCTQ